MDIKIDRLTLKLAGISERDGQHLARLITERLPLLPLSTEESRYLDSVLVNVSSAPGSSIDLLSQQIVANVLRQLEQAL